MPDPGEVRFAARSLMENAPNMYRNYGPAMPRSQSQSASINLYTDDFLAGFQDEGRMSVVRRFFCLFVTFDLFFISLLWLICILITGVDIYEALKQQILLYDVHKSLFDVVMAAVCRFVLLIVFYAILSVNHWIIIALSTTGSCSFLIYKVFAFSWIDVKEPVFQVLLIIISFVLAWGETWFLDCRVIPQERHARNYMMQHRAREDPRAPLVVPFLEVSHEPATSTFYSPFETVHNSDEEDNAQDEEWQLMGEECVLRAVKLLESSEWLIDRVTDCGDEIKHLTLAKMGKVWRVTGKINLPAKLLLEHLFYKIEDIPKWNSTILESKILHTINKHTDITYQATAGVRPVQSRDFVNLRCWQLCRDGHIVRDANDDDDSDFKPSYAWPSAPSPSPVVSASVPVTAMQNVGPLVDLSDTPPPLPSSSVENDARQGQASVNFQQTGLGKSLGASGFFDADVNSGDEELEFADAEDDEPATRTTTTSSVPIDAGKHFSSNNVYVSSAVSIDYDKMPELPRYTRAENRLSCWAMREINGQPNACIFEWVMCIDLKGFMPSSLINKVYPTIIQDYMVALRKYCDGVKAEHRRQRRASPTNNHHHQS